MITTKKWKVVRLRFPEQLWNSFIALAAGFETSPETVLKLVSEAIFQVVQVDARILEFGIKHHLNVWFLETAHKVRVPYLLYGLLADIAAESHSDVPSLILNLLWLGSDYLLAQKRGHGLPKQEEFAKVIVRDLVQFFADQSRKRRGGAPSIAC